MRTKTCKIGKEKNGNGRCVRKCIDGMKRNPTTNKCMRMNISQPTGVIDAAFEAELDADLDAEFCPFGYEKNAAGVCVKICKPNYFRDKDGKCKKIKQSVINMFKDNTEDNSSFSSPSTNRRQYYSGTPSSRKNAIRYKPAIRFKPMQNINKTRKIPFHRTPTPYPRSSL